MKKAFSIKSVWHGLILLLAFLPLTVLLTWVGLVFHEILLEKSLQQEKILQELAHDHAIQEVVRLTTMMENKSDPMAYTLAHGQDKNLLSKLIKKVLTRESSINKLLLIGLNGQVIAGQEKKAIEDSSSEIKSLFYRELVTKVLGKSHITPSHIYSNSVYFSIAVPVIEASKRKAVLYAEIDVNVLLSSLKQYMGRSGVSSYIVDLSGRILVAPKNNRFNTGDNISDRLEVDAKINDQLRPIDKSYKGIQGVEVFGLSKTIDDMGWRIVTEIDQEMIEQPIRKLIINLTLVGGLIVLIFALIGMYLVDRVIKPIQRISSGFKRVARQEFMPSTIKTSFTELDSMVVSFNKMVEELSHRQRHINKATVVFENTSEGIVITDIEGSILSVNKAFTKVTGYSEDEVVGKNPSLLQSGLQDEEFYKQMWVSISTTGGWQGEIKNCRKNGEIYTELLSINSFKDEQGKVIEYIGVFADVTGIKEVENKLKYLEYYDALTGLPNRMLCNVRMEHELQHAKRNNCLVTVMLIDLDMFKNVNDSLGHIVGDDLLKEVTLRIGSCVRSEDTVSRFGGDEFVVVSGTVKTKNDMIAFADKILDLFSEPFDIGGHEIFIGASMGISVYPEDAKNVDGLLQNADTAMYRAKAEGRNNYKFYTADLTSNANERFSTETYLRHALDNDELILHYQPQYSMETGKMIAVEALIRWHHPHDGLVFPDKFISIAEETGLIIPIGKWVIETACKQLKEWHVSGYDELRMAINLSARQFWEPGLAILVADVLIETGVSAENIDLELTESIIMRDAQVTIDTLNDFHEMGVELSIDDFGTGYSSLSYLKKFPINRLKIDREFVNNIITDKNDADMIKSIIALGHCMGLKVLAEGVEEIEQLNFLKEHGCDEVQGYFYSKPIPADDLEVLYKKEDI